MALTLDQFKVDKKKASQEEIDMALELLAKQRFTKERIKAGEIKGGTFKKVSDMTPEEKAAYKKRSAAYMAGNSLLLAKCKKLGIVNTDEEVTAYLKDKKNVDTSKYTLTVKK